MDADLATPLHHLEDVRKAIHNNADISIAVRDLLKIHDGFGRKLMSKGANLAAQILVVPGIKDTQCGFKVFSAEATEAVFSRQTMLKWSFDMELLGIARYLKFDIETFEAPDWHDPKDSIYRIVLNGLLDPFKIRWNIWSGRYRKPNYTHVQIEDV
jgi:dolichyl-phosphate beta-glucosyltransferase